MIIAIDGAAGTGKSTVCDRIAEEFGIAYFNAGLLYRGMTVWAQRRSDPVEELSWRDVASACQALSVSLDDLSTRVLIDEEDVTPMLKNTCVTGAVPTIAAQPVVRIALTLLQRQIAEECVTEGGGVVVDGRDATSVVWPNTRFRFLLIPAEERDVRVDFNAVRNALDSRHTDFRDPSLGVTALYTTRDNLGAIAEAIIASVRCSSHK